ncbi:MULTISPECIES: fimbrillin family protein [Bacteroidaceae]|uniref:fimbrillin family protein n=2 Tax=Bacteroidales TaxID=171549 RepID=UPI001F3AB564|nr:MULTISPECIES: fimbrillin family protein [Bacteroidaceae]MCF2738801.1 fimbrillin family protein [Bacteroides caecigallinarum]MDM8255454.1 fimbrillin family protein [Phocaeicola barnesiae]
MKAKTIFMATLAAAVLTACNNDENTVIDIGASQATFTAAIDGQVNTRAYDRTWEAGDAIGISGISGGITYTNVQYITDSDGTSGNFTVGTQGNEIYYQDDNSVTFTAYYPWANLAADATTITADTRAQASQSDFDFLWSRQTGSKASPNVQFIFAHKMAKLVLTIQKGNDVSYQEVQDAVLSLGGFKYSGTFNVTDGTTSTADDLATGWTFAGNTSETGYNAPFVPNATAESVSYTLILFPQEFSSPLPITATLTGMQSFSATLDFTAANVDAGDTDAKNEWVAGRQYNLSVTLHKTDITVDGCTIQGWDEANGGNVNAD